MGVVNLDKACWVSGEGEGVHEVRKHELRTHAKQARMGMRMPGGV